MAIFCKNVKCLWNRRDERNEKFRCDKLLVHIDTEGHCEISKTARSIAAGGVITPAAFGEKGKIDITDMAVGLQEVLIADGAWSCGACNAYHFSYWGDCQYCGEVRPNLPA